MQRKELEPTVIKRRDKQSQEIEQLAVDTIRVIAAEAVQKAKSGHPGMPMGVADAPTCSGAATCASTRADPHWQDRDRFILSAGHGSMLLYSLLHLTGYDLPLDELKHFRQWGSLTPGHPEYGHTPGVETTTGPLGQGFANGVGMAMAERFLAAHFNRPEHRLVRPLHLRHCQRRRPDGGRLLRGRLAGRAPRAGQAHLPLRRQPRSPSRAAPSWPSPRTSRSASRPTAGTCRRCDGHDLEAIGAGRSTAAQGRRPALADRAARTSATAAPTRQARREIHGAPLGEDEVAATKEALGWPAGPALPRAGRGAAHLVAAALGELFERYADWQAELRSLLRSNPEAGRSAGSSSARQAAAGGWDESSAAFAAGESRSPPAPPPARCCKCWPSCCPELAGRLGRPGALHQDPAQGRGDFDPRQLCRAQHPLRRARARAWARSSTAWRCMAADASLWRHFPGLRRLHAPADPPGGAHASTPVDLCLHPRQHRRRRGRPDPPAGGALRRRCA